MDDLAMIFFNRQMLALAFGMSVAISQTPAHADTAERVLILREGKTAALLDGKFTFKLLKMQGYSVDIRVDGARQRLKLGEALTEADTGCKVTFKKNSPETRIARFSTDCP